MYGPNPPISPNPFIICFGKDFRPKLVRNKEKHAEKQSRMTDNVILLHSDQFSADLVISGPDSAYFSCFFGVPKSSPTPKFINNLKFQIWSPKKSEIHLNKSEKLWGKN